MRAIAFLLISCALQAQPVVRSVSVPGTALAVKLSTQEGQPYDSRKVEADVRWLWSLDRFDDVRVHADDMPDGLALTFRTVPRRLYAIRQVRVQPNAFGFPIDLPEGARIDRTRAAQLAKALQKHVEQRGYADAQASYEFVPAPRGLTDLHLTVSPGKRARLATVRFVDGPPDAKARKLWKRGAEPGRVQAYLAAQGYLDARAARLSKTELEVRFGPPTKLPARFCDNLLTRRRDAEKQGRLDFSVSAEANAQGVLEFRIDEGQTFTVGRIQFTGHHHYSDAFIRRNMKLEEAQPFDERKLRESIARLNRTRLFETIDDRGVTTIRRTGSSAADVIIRLEERKGGTWSLSGPLGPMSLGGSLEGQIATRLPLLPSYTLSLSMYALSSPAQALFRTAGWNKRYWPVAALRRPFTPGEGWRSGFVLAPQFTWPMMLASYGVSQLQGRLEPVLAGDRGLVPELPVIVHRPWGDTVLMCEPPKPRLSLVRDAAAMALHLMGGAGL